MEEIGSGTHRQLRKNPFIPVIETQTRSRNLRSSRLSLSEMFINIECVYMFIELSADTFINIYVYTIF
jgi:hypothetical protein